MLLIFSMIRIHQYNFYKAIQWSKIYIFFITSNMIFKVAFGTQIHILKSDDKLRFERFLHSLSSVFKTLPRKYVLSYLDEDGDDIIIQNQRDYQVLLASGHRSIRINIRPIQEDVSHRNNQVHINQKQKQLIEQQVSEIKAYEDLGNKEEPFFDDSIIEQRLRKMLPQIVSRIKSEIVEEIRQKTSIKKPETEMKKQQKKLNLPVHKFVTCDNCNQKDISGVRYKCSVCPDFDFCQKCQQIIDHPHPFLKIKTPNQAPVKIFAVINQQSDHKSQPIKQEQPQINSGSLNNILHQGFDVVRGFLNGEDSTQLQGKCEAIKKEWKKKTEEWKNAYCSTEKKEQTKFQEAKWKWYDKEQKVEKQQPKKEDINDNIRQQRLRQNANYLVEVFGFGLEKCKKWAQMFPNFSKEQLLNYCITRPEFFN